MVGRDGAAGEGEGEGLGRSGGNVRRIDYLIAPATLSGLPPPNNQKSVHHAAHMALDAAGMERVAERTADAGDHVGGANRSLSTSTLRSINSHGLPPINAHRSYSR